MADRGLVPDLAIGGPGPDRDLVHVTGDLDLDPGLGHHTGTGTKDITHTGGTATVQGEFQIQNILTDHPLLTAKEMYNKVLPLGFHLEVAGQK